MASSERRAWGRVAQYATDILLRGDGDSIKAATHIREIALKMSAQLAAGVHENPSRRRRERTKQEWDVIKKALGPTSPVIKYSMDVIRYTNAGLSLAEAERRAGGPWKKTIHPASHRIYVRIPKNPPSAVPRILARDVHEVRYTHEQDGKDYRHPFDKGVEMVAIRRGGRREILLRSATGKPLWKDFR